MADDNSTSTNFDSNSSRQLKVVFVHLDLGIGGAEQLILQLAASSVAAGHSIQLVTTRCDAHHCFAQVQPGTGALYPYLHVWGQWIPATLWGGKCKALCSTVRLLYLAYHVARQMTATDVIVLDVLPTPLPLLRTLTDAALIFYCHFPDKLLLQQQKQPHPQASGLQSIRHAAPTTSVAKKFYRTALDSLEQMTMLQADTVVVNSNFTRITVQETFPLLKEMALPILYPALDTESLDSVLTQRDDDMASRRKKFQFVSLNRYERKKNIELFLHAMAYIREELLPRQQPRPSLPEIIIAGGYDIRVAENVEYRAELQQLADQLKLQVTFLQSISDSKRAELLQSSLALIYTPDKEHFGIVPIEAMYAGTAVVAVASGGPLETVQHGVTGFLCDNTATSFGTHLYKLMQDPDKTAQMGRAGRQHVIDKFGQERLLREWREICNDAVEKARDRTIQSSSYYYRMARSGVYIVEALFTLFICIIITYLLRWIGALEPTESIWGKIRTMINDHRDEL